MNISIIRHGKTKGNLEKRYIGITDEYLCDEGIKEIEYLKTHNIYIYPECVFTSPLKRCIQTSKLIFGEMIEMIIINDLKECNFGEFENKNFEQLKNLEAYKTWIQSNGKFNIDGAENYLEFKRRCYNAFESIINISLNKKLSNIALVCHGGTIMSIMERLTEMNFYDFQVTNGDGYNFDYINDKMENLTPLTI